eukprot:3552150-Pyramimonas_sp.AAC.1
MEIAVSSLTLDRLINTSRPPSTFSSRLGPLGLVRPWTSTESCTYARWTWRVPSTGCWPHGG